jgi:flagellar L-ring protein precursor FlgH
MPKSKIRKLSSSTSKHEARPPRSSRGSKKRGKRTGSEFSILKFPFAIPSSLRVLLRLAACLLLFAQLCAEASPGSLWREDHSHSMFADKRARAVGDIITILVQENNTSSKENSTKTSKSSSVDASLETILYSPAASGFLTKGGKLPAMKFGGSQSFDGGGKINNSERITARIAVRVIDTLPNGNMLVEGKRETLVSGEKQEAILHGIVRSEDVSANNTVFSYNVANASIKFIGKGTISDNQRKGWLHRIWEKITPF